MSSHLSLFSSHNISDEELAEVILQAGGTLLSDRSAFNFGFISSGQAAVGIARTPLYDGVFDDEGNLIDEEALTFVERAKELLGGEFQTWLYISLGYKPGSRRLLAVRFAYTCCQRWPCVVASERDELFSCKDIDRLYQEGGEFPG